MPTESVLIGEQIRIVCALFAGSGIVTLLFFLRDLVCPSQSRSSSSQSPPPPSSPIRAWRDPDDRDHNKVYLLAPTPHQTWTSHYSHPRSELSPSFHTSHESDEARLAELLTPSKDWWTGHKSGTAHNTPSALPKLDFDQADPSSSDESVNITATTSTTKSSRSSRASRRSTRQQQEMMKEEQNTQPTIDESKEESSSADIGPPAMNGDDEGFALNGGDDNDDSVDNASDRDESSDVSVLNESDVSPAPVDQKSAIGVGSSTSSSRRSSGTPGRHRRQWTHTIEPGVEEARIHRKGRGHLF